MCVSKIGQPFQTVRAGFLVQNQQTFLVSFDKPVRFKVARLARGAGER